MKATEQTLQQIERAIRKTADKFPETNETEQLTDIHVRVTQETGELVTFNDDDCELMRCVVEQWIDNKDDDFYDVVAKDIHRCLERQKKLIEKMSIIKPYSFVLEDDDKETIQELYVVGDDTVIINPELMEHLDEDLDSFFEQLMKE